VQQVALVDYDYANNLQIDPLIHRAESNNASSIGQQHFQGLSRAVLTHFMARIEFSD
jgi:hypothetical protein